MRPITDSDEYINGRQSCRVIGCAPSALQRAAMLGQIRVKLEEGVPPRYLRDDVLRIAEARRGHLQVAGA